MSKQSQAVTTTAAAPKPSSLYLIGPVANVLEQAAAHVRAGYTFDISLPVEHFGATGMMAFTMKLGDPDAHSIEAAKTATKEAMEIEQGQRQREIERAAEQLVADREKAAAKAIMAAKVAEAEAALAALRAAAGAA